MIRTKLLPAFSLGGISKDLSSFIVDPEKEKSTNN